MCLPKPRRCSYGSSPGSHESGWFDGRHIAVKRVSAAFTGLIVVATLWLFGMIGWTAGLIGLEQSWLKSPNGQGS